MYKIPNYHDNLVYWKPLRSKNNSLVQKDVAILPEQLFSSDLQLREYRGKFQYKDAVLQG